MAGLTGNVAMVTSGIQYAVFIVFTGIMWYDLSPAFFSLVSDRARRADFH
jgi:hypothetical protein